VTLDRERREAVVRGQSVELTKQEFDLLHQLAARPGVVYSRAALLQHVWSDDTYVTERDPQDPELILTAWGVGYKSADTET
jgi:DNA-binding response OmpR family regulator